MTTPPFGQPGAFAHLPGLAAAAPAAPAAREDTLMSGRRRATALAVDTAQAAKALRFRSDLRSGRSVASLLNPLRAGAPPAVAGETDAGALLLDLAAVNRVLEAERGGPCSPASGGWRLGPAPPRGWPLRCATAPTSRPWPYATRPPPNCAWTR